jgi:phosphoglycolate phosphatase-like HAD superfamily hydrolase
MAEYKFKRNKRLLLWDIDGTLVRTKRPNSLSPHINALKSLGYSVRHRPIESSGSTDYEVLLDLLKMNMILLNKNKLRDVFTAIDNEARQLDSISEFNLYPGVLKTLDKLSDLGWTHGILTGNTYNRMISKLSTANILKYFEGALMFSCSFGDSRREICKNALKIVNDKHYQRIFIIGDTPKDVLAARTVGFLAISVASGNHSLSELSNYNPDLLIRNLQLDSKLLIDYLKK